MFQLSDFPREVSIVIIRSKLHTMIDCIIENKHLIYFVIVIMNNVLYIIQFPESFSSISIIHYFLFYHVLGASQ